MTSKITVVNNSLEKLSPMIKYAIDLILDKNLDAEALENSLSTFVSPTHLGNSFAITINEQPNNIRVSLFYLACLVKNKVAIETLLKIHPNIINQKIAGLNNPIHAIISDITKENEQLAIECLSILFDYDSKVFSNKYGKETSWTMLFDKFTVSTNFESFYTYCLAQKSDCFSLYELYYIMKKYNINLFNHYPLINDIITYENKQLHYVQDSNYLYNIDLLSDSSLNIEEFFKNNSLTKTLESRYGIKSPRINYFVSNKLFYKRKHIFELKFRELIKMDFLKEIFLQPNQENFSDFLDLMESDSSILEMIPNIVRKYSNQNQGKPELIKMAELFKSIYTNSQIKNILLENKKISKTTLDDIFSMYSENKTEYTNYLKTISFNKLDTLEKLHDEMSEAIEMMDQEFFELDQCTNYPLLNKLNEIIMPEDYGVKLANDSYELVRWGSLMGHCIGGGDYADDCREGDCVILAITYKNQPKYAIEIRMNNHKGKLNQVQGKSRAEPPAEILVSLLRGLRDIGIVSQSENYIAWNKR